MQEARSRRVLAGVLGAMFAAILLYKVLHAGHLEQTSIFYVGIPAVIAVTVALTARFKSVTGLIMGVVTICLALAGPLLDEGIVCLLMAAPLFYLVGAIVGVIVDRSRKGGLQAAVTPLLLLGLVQVGSDAVATRHYEASAVRAVHDRDLAAALASAPGFGPVDSAFLRLGFPRPQSSTGTGLRVGDTREIVFTPRRSLGIGARLEPRTMTLRVTAGEPGRVVFAVVRDTTLARWMNLREAEFTWSASDLRVTLRYERTFDPAWYFGPLQQYAAGEAAGYLAETFTR